MEVLRECTEAGEGFREQFSNIAAAVPNSLIEVDAMRLNFHLEDGC